MQAILARKSGLQAESSPDGGALRAKYRGCNANMIVAAFGASPGRSLFVQNDLGLAIGQDPLPVDTEILRSAYGLVSRNHSPRGVELAKALLGLHATFDCAVILLHDVVQVLDRSMAETEAQGSFRFRSGNRCAVERGLIGVDDAGLRM